MPRTLKLEVFRNLTKTWRNCREQYPGWVIAPADARETLWNHTEQWLDLIPAALSRMKPDEALFLASETVWRIDTALSPMLLSQAEMVTTVLGRINPAPRFLQWPCSPELVDKGDSNGSRLLPSWISTAFSIMREAREDFDIPRFRLWQQRLERIVKERSEWLARWHFEQSIVSLWQLDFDALERALQDWPSQLEQLPFWEVKRAALWAELGDIQRAETIAQAALDAIRGRTRSGAADFQNLSEEGWSMRLLMALRHSRADFMPESERARFQQRFSDLARYKCNPWDITDWLELALKAPRPSVRRAETESLTFDPGTYSTRFSQQRHGPIETARPAFAFLRVMEEAAMPLRVSRLTMLTPESRQIPVWIAPFAFSWAVATAIRSDEEEVVKRLLDRTNIGVIKQGQVDVLAEWLTDVCEQSLKTFTTPSSHGWERPLPERILGAVAEGLSRLVLRVEPAQVNRVIALAEDICRIQSPNTFFGAMKHIDAIFRRSIAWCMTREQILARIPNWLALPLPSEIGGLEDLHHDHAEPFYHITIDGKTKWNRPSDSTITRRIRELQEAVVNGSRMDRQRASIRLVVVARLGGLSTSEVRELRKGLWSKVDPVTSLAIHTSVRLTALLRYCPFPEENQKVLVRHAFLELPIPRVRNPNADGTGFSVDNANATRWIANLADVTLGLWTSPDARRYCVNWSPVEAAVLLRRITEWWDSEKSVFSSPSQGEKLFTLDPIRHCAEEIIDLLGDGLFRTLEKRRGTQALGLLGSMEAMGLNTLPAKPTAIRLGLRRKLLVTEILTGIHSRTAVDVRTALRAIQNWRALKAVRRTAQPDVIVTALVWKVSFRQTPALDTVMNVLAHLLNRGAMRLSADQVDRLLFGLKFLIVETELPEHVSVPLLMADERESIPYEQRPNHRLAASRIARALGRFLRRSKRILPEIVHQWRNVSDASSLPELRKVWRAGSDDDY